MIELATRQLLEASFVPGLGVGGLRKMVSELLARPSALPEIGALAASYARPGAKTEKKYSFQGVLSRCSDEGISVISPLDDHYPRQLLSIEDWPPILYVKGDLKVLSKRGCAVVGTREASKLGLSWARQIAELICDRGFVVVSGLALGIDTAGHEGALKVGGQTTAVLAHGLDKVTPASNRELATRILNSGGCLVAEHPPGVPPFQPEYVRRNRIQSGLSMCSIVVESNEEGGAIHQGNFTLKQHRPLFCVLPDAGVPGFDEFKSGGAKKLLAAGGRRIANRQDLTDALDLSVGKADASRVQELPEVRLL